jgi:hypothetical protein
MPVNSGAITCPSFKPDGNESSGNKPYSSDKPTQLQASTLLACIRRAMIIYYRVPPPSLLMILADRMRRREPHRQALLMVAARSAIDTAICRWRIVHVFGLVIQGKPGLLIAVFQSSQRGP